MRSAVYRPVAPSRGIHEQGGLNLLLDTVAAALLTVLVGTGYLLLFMLPPGTNRTPILWGSAPSSVGHRACLDQRDPPHRACGAVALYWRWLVMGLSRRFGVATWAARSPRLAGLTY